MEADIFVDIRFCSSDEGGRKSAIPSRTEYYGCPFEHNAMHNDCRLLLKDFGEICPGDTLRNVPIVFMCPELVMHKLNEGDRFTLWEGGTKAEGTIIRIMKKSV